MVETISFFDDKAEEQERARKLLSYVLPASEEDVRMVAAAMKSHGPKFEDVYVTWAAPYGRYKAKRIWERTRADPDAFTEVIQRQIFENEKKQRFKLFSATEILNQRQQSWTVKGVLPQSGIAAVYGPSTSGKSFLCLDLVTAIAEGAVFFGHKTKARAVLYIGLEGEGGYRNRILAWEKYQQRSLPTDIRFLLQQFSITDERDVVDIAENCPQGCVIVIDTLNRAAPNMDENSSRDMGNTIEGAKTLQRLTKGLVILVAHTGKDAAKGLRGHSSLFAALDAAILVQREGDNRSWRTEKAKDGKDGEVHQFQLQVIEVGIDDDGDVQSSCVVVQTQSTVSSHKPLTAGQLLGLSTYNEAVSSFGKVDDDGKFTGLHVDAWREAFYKSSTADNVDSKRKAFSRARDDLVKLGRLRVQNDLYFPAGQFGALTEESIAVAIKAAGSRHETKAGHERDMSQ